MSGIQRDYVLNIQPNIREPNNNNTISTAANNPAPNDNPLKRITFYTKQEATRDDDEDYGIARAIRIDLIEYESSRNGLYAKYIKWHLWLDLIHIYEASKASRISSETYFNNLSSELQNLLSTGDDDYYARTESAVRFFLFEEGYRIVPGFELWDFGKLKRKIVYTCEPLETLLQELDIKINAIKEANPKNVVFFTDNGQSMEVEVYTDKQLGEGHFGEVCEGKATTKGKATRVAVKKMKYKNHFWREMDIVKGLNSPTERNAVATMLGYNATLGYIVFQLAEGGNLENALKEGTVRNMDDATRFSLSLDLAYSLLHLHQRWIVHLDLFPKNILLHEKKALLADFGAALQRNTSPLQEQQYLGALPVHAVKKGNTFAVDTYLLTCAIVQLFEGIYLTQKQLLEELKVPGTFLTQIQNYPWLSRLFYQNWNSPTQQMHDISHIICELENNRPLYSNEGPDPITIQDFENFHDSLLISKMWRMSQSLCNEKQTVMRLLNLTGFSFWKKMRRDLFDPLRRASVYQIGRSNYKPTLGEAWKHLYANSSCFPGTDDRDLPIGHFSGILFFFQFLVNREKNMPKVFEGEEEFKKFRQSILSVFRETDDLLEVSAKITSLCEFPVFVLGIFYCPNFASTIMSIIDLVYFSHSRELAEDRIVFRGWLLRVHEKLATTVEKGDKAATLVVTTIVNLLSLLPVDAQTYATIKSHISLESSSNWFQVDLQRATIHALLVMGTKGDAKWCEMVQNDLRELILADNIWASGARESALEAFATVVASEQCSDEIKDKKVSDLCNLLEHSFSPSCLWLFKFVY